MDFGILHIVFKHLSTHFISIVHKVPKDALWLVESAIVVLDVREFERNFKLANGDFGLV